jgi:glucosamine--fructose-6-phosphate aminotransferase (isomerizing)
LANHSYFNFPTHAGHEVGVATKTFTSSLALLYLLQRVLLGLPLPPACDELSKVADQMQLLLDQSGSWRQALFEHLAPAKTLAVIGRGPGMAAAMNGALVLQEAVRLPAASYTGGQFRHGPMESVSEQLGAIVLTNAGVTANLNLKLGRDIATRGGRVVWLGQTHSAESDVYASSNLGANLFPLELPSPPEDLSALLSILPMQLLAADLASRAGITPGEFRWSGKVITTE